MDPTGLDIAATGNLVPDAYFAALAIESGSEWITDYRDFTRFPGLRWRHPPTPEPALASSRGQAFGPAAVIASPASAANFSKFAANIPASSCAFAS